MKQEFDLNKKLKQLAERARVTENEIRASIIRNIRSSCSVMERVAKEHTPNSGDGKKRGYNVINNSLQNAWTARYIRSENKKTIGKVILENPKSYAPFVQFGHKLKKHFVPWLYKDSNGTISYETNHNQPMFGIVVGTKTTYVKGVDMIGPARQAFFEKFNLLNDRTVNRILSKRFGEIK